VWVANLPSGKPELQFSPSLKSLLEKKRIQQAHLSLADERGIAVATVILECAK
jgi:phosphopantetheinyl transferase (holo-ACP synthase)